MNNKNSVSPLPQRKRRGLQATSVIRERVDSGELSDEEALAKLEGWKAYASFANTYTLRMRVTEYFEKGAT